MKKFWMLGFICSFLFIASQGHAKAITVGMLLAGPHDDNSYNQFHLDAARKAADDLSNIKVIYIDQVNPQRRPLDQITIPDMVDDLIQKGASVIVSTAYEMELGIALAASRNPQVTFIQINGLEALMQDPLPNIINVTLMFEQAQMLAGFAAGMASPSGKIAYLATSPNPESYRQISAAYLGAKYAWERIREMQPKDFRFRVKWMGNWFDNLSPHEDVKTSVARLLDNGSDTIIGGNDNTEILTTVQLLYDNGKTVLVTATANPFVLQNVYPFLVGTSYYNWYPVYLDLFQKAQQSSLSSSWLKLAPELTDMNKFGRSNVGFIPYDGLTINGKIRLQRFVTSLAGGLNLFKGPLFYKDGSVFVEEDQQTPSAAALRTMSQLLFGIEEIPYAPPPEININE